jgi:pimeloyl-ACP methyl ester carboxylesterase
MFRILRFGGTLFLITASVLVAVTPAPERFAIAAEGQTVLLPYASYGDFIGGSTTATRAIISLHGLNGSAVDYRDNAQTAASMVPGALESTLVIAPHFLRNGFITGAVDPQLVYWNASPYWGSNQALVGPNATPVRLSAFSVLDQIVDRLLDVSLFPQIHSIIFVGHSAGGQLVNRYAASSPRESTARVLRDVHFRYLVLAPSSFVYMDETRSVSDGAQQFEVPNTICTTYNNYGYGLAQLYSYHSNNGVNANIMRAQYASRFVMYLVGSSDADPNASDLDKSCQAMLQGSHRLERASIYFNYLQSFYGPQITDLHTFSIAPGVGHSGRRLMTSSQGLRLIFDHDLSDIDRDGHSDWSEWVWGSDSQATGSVPMVKVSEFNAERRAFSVSWFGRSHRLYRVLVSSDLVNWQPASGWLNGTNQELVHEVDANKNTSLFTRIEARLR